MDDNRGLEYAFTKRPFKGKGATRLAIRLLIEQTNLITADMESLCRDYKSKFRDRCIHLVIHRRPCLSMQWREPVSGGRYVDLFGSDNGKSILVNIREGALPHVCEFEKRRLQLNTEMSIHCNAMRSYQRYLRALSELEDTDD